MRSYHLSIRALALTRLGAFDSGTAREAVVRAAGALAGRLSHPLGSRQWRCRSQVCSMSALPPIPGSSCIWLCRARVAAGKHGALKILCLDRNV